LIFAGSAVDALDPANGQTLWRWDPPSGRAVTGPVVLHGETILVPCNGQIVFLNSASGTVMDATLNQPVLPRWHELIEKAAMKKLLEEIGAAKSFAPSAQP